MPRTRATQPKLTETYNKKKGKKSKSKLVDLTEDDKMGAKRKRTNEDKVDDVNLKTTKEEPKKEKLEQFESFLVLNFDLNPYLGPCRGITRTERWERAVRYQIDSECLYEVQQILDAHCDDYPKFNTCVWDQRHY